MVSEFLQKYKEKGYREAPKKLTPQKRAKVVSKSKEGEKYQVRSPYPFDQEDNTIQHGGARTHAVSDISVMTKTNVSETTDKDLKRALQWDGNYNWDVTKTEIFNNEISKICSQLHLGKKFRERCHYFFRKVREWANFTSKKLEDLATAFVYFMCRYDDKPITFLDFKKMFEERVSENRLSKTILKRVEEIKRTKPVPSKLEDALYDHVKEKVLDEVRKDVKNKMADLRKNVRFFQKVVLVVIHECRKCDYVWDDRIQRKRFVTLPDDWSCPECGNSRFRHVPIRNLKPINSKLFVSRFVNNFFQKFLEEEKILPTSLITKIVMQMNKVRSMAKVDLKTNVWDNVRTIGAIFYLVTKRFDGFAKITQDKVADFCGVSTVTLREKIGFLRRRLKDD